MYKNLKWRHIFNNFCTKFNVIHVYEYLEPKLLAGVSYTFSFNCNMQVISDFWLKITCNFFPVSPLHFFLN